MQYPRHPRAKNPARINNEGCSMFSSAYLPASLVWNYVVIKNKRWLYVFFLFYALYVFPTIHRKNPDLAQTAAESRIKALAGCLQFP